MVINEGEVGRAVRRDSPWWSQTAWQVADRDLRDAAATGIDYDPDPLGPLVDDGLYLLYGPRRVGKTVSIKRAITRLLAAGVEPLRIVRVSVDGWRANRLGTLYEYVTRVATTSLGDGAHRYWFVDEVTATEGPWWSVVKDLRDNTGLRDDCVVLTGSSNRGLDEAVKALAGRRGQAVSPDRALLPMGFRAFCQALGLASPPSPALRPDGLRTPEARSAWLDLTPWTDHLVAAWQAYLEVGGYPRAVGDWRRGNQIATATWASLWDVVRGEAVTAGVSEATVAALLDGLARRLASAVSVGPMAEAAGVHRTVLEARLEALAGAFLVWACPAADATGHPSPRRQRKQYFLDPLVARIPELAHGSRPVDVTVLSEQQLGVELLRWNERVRPGSLRSGGWVAHYRSAGTEVDFAGRCADTQNRATPLEAKYVSGTWRREALTIRNSELREGVLATRDVLAVQPEDPVWAVPAAFVAYSLSG